MQGCFKINLNNLVIIKIKKKKTQNKGGKILVVTEAVID